MAADMVATGAGYESIAALNAAGGLLHRRYRHVCYEYLYTGRNCRRPDFGKRVQTSLQKAKNTHGAMGALLTGVLSLAIIKHSFQFRLWKGPVYLAVVVTSCVIVMIHMAVIKKFRFSGCEISSWQIHFCWAWRRPFFVGQDTWLMGRRKGRYYHG